MNAIEDEVSARTVDQLVRIPAGPAVSIYLPTHPASLEGQQDAIRLKNLLREAETSLNDRGLTPDDARRLLKPATKLAEDDAFWHDRRRGLAFFISGDCFRSLRLPREFAEEVAVDERFHVRQLLPLIGSEGSAIVLAISRNGFRLVSVSSQGYRELDASALPRNMDEALDIEDADRGEQVHVGAMPGPGGRKRSAVFHGQGGKPDALKQDLEQYFRVAVRVLHTMLKDSREPLVLAGPRYELPIFRYVCDLPQLSVCELYGNFDHSSDQEIFEKAAPVVRDLLQAPLREAATKFARFADSDRALIDVEPLLRAARHGRVETLFLDIRAKLFGSVDRESESVRLRDASDAEDLLDLLAVETLRNGGDVYAVEPNEMPVRAAVAGILRY